MAEESKQSFFEKKDQKTFMSGCWSANFGFGTVIRLSRQETKVFWFFFSKKNRFWTFGFLLLAILSGPVLVLHVPPGHAPDEGNHILRADSLRYGQFIGHREHIDGKAYEGLLADIAFIRVMTLLPTPLNTSPQPISPVQKWLATQVPWDAKPVFLEAGSIAGYMPLPYVPGAVAIGLCRAAGLSPMTAFLAVRIVNFYCFLLLGAVALSLTRRGVVLIFATLLLPMTLSLAASCSQDGILIGGTACAVACLTRAMDSPAEKQTRWRIATASLLAVIAACKPPYAPLALLLLLPLGGGPIRLARRLGIVLVTILPAAAWTILEARVANVAVRRAPSQAGPLWPGPAAALFDGPDPGAQIQVLLHHKAMIAILPLQAVLHGAGDLLQQAVGVLDYLCLTLPSWLYLAWYAGLACAIAAHLCSAGQQARQTSLDFPVACSAILLSVIAVGIALYLDWTPVGMAWIGGLQGRYFLPLLLVLPLCLPRFSRPGCAALLAVPSVLAAMLSAAVLPGVIEAFYPLR